MGEYAHGAFAALAALLPRGAEPGLVRGVALPRRHQLGLRVRESAHVTAGAVTLRVTQRILKYYENAAIGGGYNIKVTHSSAKAQFPGRLGNRFIASTANWQFHATLVSNLCFYYYLRCNLVAHDRLELPRLQSRPDSSHRHGAVHWWTLRRLRRSACPASPALGRAPQVGEAMREVAAGAKFADARLEAGAHLWGQVDDKILIV